MSNSEEEGCQGQRNPTSTHFFNCLKDKPTKDQFFYQGSAECCGDDRQKGAPSFRSKFQKFLIIEFKDEIDITNEKNQGLQDDILLQFIVTSYVGIVEWWIKNEMPKPPEVMAEQVGILLDRNL